jgi:hypothetical protein
VIVRMSVYKGVHPPPVTWGVSGVNQSARIPHAGSYQMHRTLLNSGPFIKNLLHNHSVIYKIIIFFFRRSKRQRNFSLFYFDSQES